MLAPFTLPWSTPQRTSPAEGLFFNRNRPCIMCSSVPAREPTVCVMFAAGLKPVYIGQLHRDSDRQGGRLTWVAMLLQILHASNKDIK